MRLLSFYIVFVFLLPFLPLFCTFSFTPRAFSRFCFLHVLDHSFSRTPSANSRSFSFCAVSSGLYRCSVRTLSLWLPLSRLPHSSFLLAFFRTPSIFFHVFWFLPRHFVIWFMEIFKVTRFCSPDLAKLVTLLFNPSSVFS